MDIHGVYRILIIKKISLYSKQDSAVVWRCQPVWASDDAAVVRRRQAARGGRRGLSLSLATSKQLLALGF